MCCHRDDVEGLLTANDERSREAGHQSGQCNVTTAASTHISGNGIIMSNKLPYFLFLYTQAFDVLLEAWTDLWN